MWANPGMVVRTNVPSSSLDTENRSSNSPDTSLRRVRSENPMDFLQNLSFFERPGHPPLTSRYES